MILSPNKADAPNLAGTSQFAIGSPWRGVVICDVRLYGSIPLRLPSNKHEDENERHFCETPTVVLHPRHGNHRVILFRRHQPLG